jgi:tRNA (Thr-GGU) A37 N-methylase
MKVLGRQANILHVSGMDLIEDTPILDIKPYTPRDRKDDIKIGWLTGKIQ